MAGKKTPSKVTQDSVHGFTEAERSAMRERAQELKSGSKTGRSDGESDVLAKIAGMPEPYRTMGGRLHAIIRANAPTLSPRTWYGMPAYTKEGDVVVYFRGGEKFKERYMTLGFNDTANLDDGHLWPVAYALTEVTATEETRIAALVRKALG